ncbi:MAG: D-alanyl-D-alanine carboxypeptidase/D-alanyl-D-alanine-endopeptidase [Casimicrobiaceae bacterium]
MKASLAIRVATVVLAGFAVAVFGGAGMADAQPRAALGAALPPPIAQAFRRAEVPLSAVALYVREVGAPAPRVSHRAGVPMNPASTMKILTTSMALDLLGRDFTWKTDVLAAGPIIDGVLAAPLILRGSGDPKFTWEHLRDLVSRLRAAGLATIAGDILVDRSHFGPIRDTAETFDGQTLKPYNVAPDALLFNFKSVGFRFTPESDGSVTVTTDGPPPDGLTIVNQLRAGPGPCGDWRQRIESRFDNGPNAARAIFAGTYPSECGEREWYVSLFDHNGLIAGTFARLWREAGGQWSGILRDGVAPREARLLAQHRSAPVLDAVGDINKFSNNVMTRQLMLTLDVEMNGPPARLDRLTDNARRWARSRMIDAESIIIENGSGLSRIERLTAAGLAQILEYGLTAPWSTEFIASLPVAGIDGTLSKRLAGGSAQGRAFLKTGTLTGVKALAGYLVRPDGRKLLFVCFVNHPNAEAAVPAMDAAVEYFMQPAAAPTTGTPAPEAEGKSPAQRNPQRLR